MCIQCLQCTVRISQHWIQSIWAQSAVIQDFPLTGSTHTSETFKSALSALHAGIPQSVFTGVRKTNSSTRLKQLWAATDGGSKYHQATNTLTAKYLFIGRMSCQVGELTLRPQAKKSNNAGGLTWLWAHFINPTGAVCWLIIFWHPAG